MGVLGVQMVSLSTGGIPANGPSDFPSLSADGRYVAFESLADNIATGDTNGTYDVFVCDTVTGATERVSISTTGQEGDDWSIDPAISSDGRYVAFMSLADNLVPGDVNGVTDIFVRDRLTSTTELVSLSSSGVPGDAVSTGPDITADGRFVAFASWASTLVASDTNGHCDVFVRDRLNGTAERVNLSVTGAQADSDSWSPAISDDGRCVAFISWAKNLYPGVASGRLNVYLRDRAAHTTEIISVSAGGTPTSRDCIQPDISADGSIVTFHTAASILVPGDTNSAYDVYARDRAAGTTERISKRTGGQGASNASVSADGRTVAFHSRASGLVQDDTNGLHDIFVYDRAYATTQRVTLRSDGGSWRAALSADGRSVAFVSAATGIGPADSNAVDDVFLAALSEPLEPRPDGHVLDDGVWAGDNIYNTTGRGQTRRRDLVRGQSATYRLQVQNDRDEASVVRVRGRAGNGEWSVTYLDQASTDITQDVTGAGWLTESLASGAAVQVAARVRPTREASAGAKLTILMAVGSESWSGSEFATQADTLRLTSKLVDDAGAGLCEVLSLDALQTRAGAQFALTLSTAARVDARVMNIAGRPVATICRDRGCPAGPSTLVWAGRSDSGLPAPNGSYVIEVIARDQTGRRVRRLTQLRIDRPRG